VAMTAMCLLEPSEFFRTSHSKSNVWLGAQSNSVVSRELSPATGSHTEVQLRHLRQASKLMRFQLVGGNVKSRINGGRTRFFSWSSGNLVLAIA
jgi:hypothetical protein